MSHSTYTEGFTVITKAPITKNDIIILCELLENKKEYINLCKFEPERISEGGIVFKFKDESKEWYKSVRFKGKHRWPFIKKDSLPEWKNNNDIIFEKNNEIVLFLKSFYNAPPFTLPELKLWNECLNQIGMSKKGRYPSKKSLSNK